MIPTHHALAAAVAAVPLRRAGWSWPALALFTAGAVLLDADHYAAYVLHTGRWSLAGAYRFHRQHGIPWTRAGWRPWRPPLLTDRMRPAHAVLPVATLWGATALLAPPLLPAAWGAVYHYLVDYLAIGVERAQPGWPPGCARAAHAEPAPAGLRDY